MLTLTETILDCVEYRFVSVHWIGRMGLNVEQLSPIVLYWVFFTPVKATIERYRTIGNNWGQLFYIAVNGYTCSLRAVRNLGYLPSMKATPPFLLLLGCLSTYEDQGLVAEDGGLHKLNNFLAGLGGTDRWPRLLGL